MALSASRIAASKRSLACAIGAGILQPGGPTPPAGFTRSTINGEPVTYLGFPVFDNGVNVITLGA